MSFTSYHLAQKPHSSDGHETIFVKTSVNIYCHFENKEFMSRIKPLSQFGAV